MSARSRFEMTTALITAVGVLFGVVFTAFGLYYTAQTLKATQEGQITDRYTKAVELLASPACRLCARPRLLPGAATGAAVQCHTG